MDDDYGVKYGIPQLAFTVIPYCFRELWSYDDVLCPEDVVTWQEKFNGALIVSPTVTVVCGKCFPKIFFKRHHIYMTPLIVTCGYNDNRKCESKYEESCVHN